MLDLSIRVVEQGPLIDCKRIWFYFAIAVFRAMAESQEDKVSKRFARTRNHATGGLTARHFSFSLTISFVPSFRLHVKLGFRKLYPRLISHIRSLSWKTRFRELKRHEGRTVILVEITGDSRQTMAVGATNEEVEDKGEVVKGMEDPQTRGFLQTDLRTNLTAGSLTHLPWSSLYLASAQHSKTMLSSSFR